MTRFLRNNGLVLSLLLLFLLSWSGQIVAGLKTFNEDLEEHGRTSVGLVEYLHSGHFLESTFENWESEFLQMGLLVILSIGLYQRGSAESNPLPEEHPRPKHFKKRYFVNSPWLRRLFENSLSLALLGLFLVCFCGHLYGGWREENLKRAIAPRPKPPLTPAEFFVDSGFWFQSMQNWQSEFLSAAAITYLSVFLRQKGSAQSKEVDAPQSHTGD